MSIWSSISTQDEVHALDGHDDDANYRAKGQPQYELDIATTWHHDHIRLAIDSIGHHNAHHCLLLPPTDATRLRNWLTEALNRRHPKGHTPTRNEAGLRTPPPTAHTEPR